MLTEAQIDARPTAMPRYAKRSLQVAIISCGIALASMAIAVIAVAKGSRSTTTIEAITTKTGRTAWPALTCDGLTIRDSTGAVVLIGTGGIEAVSPSGKNIWNLSVLDDGPALSLYDKTGNLRLVLGVANIETKATGDSITSSPGSLTIFDAKGDVLVRVPR